RPLALRRHEAPLQPGRKTCAATATQVRALDLVDDIGRRAAKSELERLIATLLLHIDVDIPGIFEIETPGEELRHTASLHRHADASHTASLAHQRRSRNVRSRASAFSFVMFSWYSRLTWSTGAVPQL